MRNKRAHPSTVLYRVVFERMVTGLYTITIAQQLYLKIVVKDSVSDKIQ